MRPPTPVGGRFAFDPVVDFGDARLREWRKFSPKLTIGLTEALEGVIVEAM